MHAQGLQPHHIAAELGLPGAQHVDTAIDALGLRAKRPSKGTRRHKAQPRQAPSLSPSDRARLSRRGSGSASGSGASSRSDIRRHGVTCALDAIAATPSPSTRRGDGGARPRERHGRRAATTPDGRRRRPRKSQRFDIQEALVVPLHQELLTLPTLSTGDSALWASSKCNQSSAICARHYRLAGVHLLIRLVLGPGTS